MATRFFFGINILQKRKKEKKKDEVSPNKLMHKYLQCVTEINLKHHLYKHHFLEANPFKS